MSTNSSIQDDLKIKLLILYAAVVLLMAPQVMAQETIIETVQKAMPSVVSIIAENDQVFDTPQTGIEPRTGRILTRHEIKQATLKRSGAGVIVDPSGIIVTNTHTIINAKRISVILHDKTSFPAQVLGFVSQYDFAFLRIPAPYPLMTISWADSDQIHLKDEIVTIGHSDLLKEAISGGRIIGIGVKGGKNIHSTQGEETKLIQVNINIYKGDSGGPIFDRKGQFLGLMVAGEMKADRSSFAIPSNQIKEQSKKYILP